jgi:hypothetical protein
MWAKWTCISVAAISALALAACQPPAGAPKADDAAPPKAVEAPTKSAPVVQRFSPAGGEADDSSFRGPMTLEAAPGAAAGGGKRYRFGWRDGQHAVLAVEVGAAKADAVIDIDEKRKPITLASAVGAPAGASIILLAVEDETLPLGDPDFTPLCGIRTITHIALYEAGDRLTLATSSGAFGTPGARGCSNAISYTVVK